MMLLGISTDGGEVNNATFNSFLYGAQLGKFESSCRAMSAIVKYTKELKDIGDVFINKINYANTSNARILQNVVYFPAPSGISILSLIAFREAQ
jgi:hypothetical protein